MSYLGSWKVDDVLTFYANTTVFATGVATDADAVPAYRVYEDETGTAILTGTMALLDSANTAGFYSEQITLSAANGFEKGKQYAIYKSATVSSVAGATHDTFQMEAEVDANVVSDKTGYALSAAGSATLTEGYRADGSGGTLAQILYEILAHLGETSISGTTKTINQVDGATAAATFTLNSATAPTSITRAT